MPDSRTRVDSKWFVSWTFEGCSFSQAAAEQGVTPATARKWLGRYLAGGESALEDASSRPAKSPRAIDPAKALLIVELRRRCMLQSHIARSVGMSESTVSRVLARAGLSKLSDLKPTEPVQRYEHEAPGDMLHIDTKKLGRIVRPSHRVTGNRRDSVNGAGWETLFVAIDDHARISFTAMHPDEKTPQAVQFLKNAVAYYAGLGVTIQRLLTDNGSAFRSRDFAKTCVDLGIKHRFTRAHLLEAPLVVFGRPKTLHGVETAQAAHGAKGGGLGRGAVCAAGTRRLLPSCTSNAVPNTCTLLGLATVSTYHHSHTTRCAVTSSSM